MVEFRVGLVGALNEDINVEKHELGAQLGVDTISYFGFQANIFQYLGPRESEDENSL